MKIGIVTYHRANNYGAELQAYALFKYLKNLGYDVEFVDYWPKYHSRIYSISGYITRFLLSLKDIRRLFLIFGLPYMCLKLYFKNRRYDLFRKKNMVIGPKEGDASYDVVFYGSDTIWNNKLNHGFDSMYWGDDKVVAKYKFSYAPSMGNVIDSEESLNFCKMMLPHFTRISVREQNLQRKLMEWGWNDVIQVMDPVFLLSKEQWSEIITPQNCKEDYVLSYNLEKSVVVEDVANQISQKYKIRKISLTGYVEKSINRNVIDMAGPIEFLRLIENAKYIVTSSFHGVVFSIIFEKQFCFHSTAETERISSILDLCNLSNRFVKKANCNIWDEAINYKEVKERLNVMKRQSYKYISDCIEYLK